MKRVINASKENPAQLPITKLTEDEIYGLPDNVTLVTRVPGSTSGEQIFKVVNKDKLKNPDKCFMIDSYWGYAHGEDIYIASRSDVESYMQHEIDTIKAQYNKYRRFAL